MERLSKIFDEKYASVTLIFLTLFAFAVRGVIFYYWMDAPGDGPTKAMYAYNWYKSPHIIPHGIWLPGFEYLTGSFSILVNNPLFSIRLLNLIAGTLTIPLLYLLSERFITMFQPCSPARFFPFCLCMLDIASVLSRKRLFCLKSSPLYSCW